VDSPASRSGDRPTRVLIAGGGVAALEALLALRDLAAERVSPLLLTPEPDFVYRPMAVGEPFDRGRVYRFDLAEIVADQGAELRIGELASVEPDTGVIRTSEGTELPYDALLVACGGVPVEWLSGALTFGSPSDALEMRRLLAGLEVGTLREVAFVLPGGAGWPLPLYELALMTATWLAKEGNSEAQLTLVTPEGAPLEMFGPQASDAVGKILEERGVHLLTNTYPAALDEWGLELVPNGRLPAERVVTLPRLEGPRIGGLAHDDEGFLPIDDQCRVGGEANVYAAGDATNFPIKQGGIAAQQADVVATEIARSSGVEMDPSPFRPVLRGLLLTGEAPEFLRAELAGGQGDAFSASAQPLWWPPGKVAGKYLAPYLATITEAAMPNFEVELDNSLRIDIQLSPESS
jgi:sulfide:quinone oxidoreductase